MILLKEKAGRFWLAVLLLSYKATAGFPSTTSHKAKAVVSFRVTSAGFILIDAKLGKDSDGTFLLDSGSSLALLLDSDASSNAKLPARSRSPLHIQGSSPGSADSIDWRETRVHQNKVTLVEGVWPTADLGPISRAIDVPLSGLLGAAVLSRYVVRMDYEFSQLSFFDPSGYHYAGKGISLPVEPDGDTGLFIVKSKVTLADCTTLPMRLLLDSGADPDVTFNHHFLDAHPHFGILESDPRSVGVGTGSTNGIYGNVHSINIGGLPVAAPRTLAERQDSTVRSNQFSEGSIDAGILSQFTIIFDRPHGRVIFEPRTDKPPAVAKPCVGPEVKP